MTTTAVAAEKSRLPVAQRYLALIVIWAVLVAAPFWLPLVGGYTALAGRVLVFGLAAMGLNLLLGFTGVLSFGHAAYFGLGAYGAGLTLRYLVHSTPLAMLAGTLLGGRGWHAVRHADRAPARRLFCDVHHRLRPALVLPRL